MMNMSKLRPRKEVVLGRTGSGKTVLIASLCGQLAYSCIQKDGIFANMNASSPDGDLDLMNTVATAFSMGRKSVKDLIGKVKGTIAMSHYDFEMNINNENESYEIPTHFLDYRGGATTGANDKEQLEETAIIMEELENADVVRVLVEGPILYTYRDDIEQAKILTGAIFYNQYFTTLSKLAKKDNVSVVVTITKSDSEIIPDDCRKNGYLELKKLAIKVLDSVFCYAKQMSLNHHWVYSIIPVAACEIGMVSSEFNATYGTYYSVPKPGARFVPNNVETWYLMGTCLQIEAEMKGIDNSIKFYTDELCSINMKSLFDRKANKARYEDAKKNIASLSKQREMYAGVTGTIRKLLANQLDELTVFSA